MAVIAASRICCPGAFRSRMSAWAWGVGPTPGETLGLAPHRPAVVVPSDQPGIGQPHFGLEQSRWDIVELERPASRGGERVVVAEYGER